MNNKVLTEEQKNLWEKLAGVKEIKPFYLAGGTAIALHLGHRESIDFDFFQTDSFDLKKIIQKISSLGRLSVEDRSPDTFVGTLEGVKISFFKYPYPQIAPLHSFKGISVADLKDIVAMKIIAISQRGVKKDFIDLFAILNAGWNFEAIFECVERKYPKQQYNKIHLLKSLTYFQDAKKDPMPKMLQDVSWDKVKLEIVNGVERFLRKE